VRCPGKGIGATKHILACSLPWPFPEVTSCEALSLLLVLKTVELTAIDMCSCLYYSVTFEPSVPLRVGRDGASMLNDGFVSGCDCDLFREESLFFPGELV
jgi:hypothetical protein